MRKGFEQCLDTFLEKAVNQLGVPGVDCIIYQDHQQIYRHAAGYMDVENQVPVASDALYNIYSATKVMTSVAAMQLVEQGKLRLTDPLDLYLPEFSNMMVKYGTFTLLPAVKKIQIAHLLSMTSGISYDPATPEKRRMLEQHPAEEVTNEMLASAIASEPLLFEPGEHWHYGYNMEVLGRVIEVISGKSLGQYMKDHIFDPLGMVDTGFRVPDDKKHRVAPQYQYNSANGSISRISSEPWSVLGESGGGGIITTVEDYILFADALACGGVGKNGVQILSPRTIQLISENQLNATCLEDFHKMKPYAGMGWGLGVSTIFSPSAAYTLAPQYSIAWGGVGGCMNHIDPTNRVSFFISQHAIAFPKDLVNPNVLNILYAHL